MRRLEVTDVTSAFDVAIGGDVRAAIEGLSVLRRHFGRETISAAIGEVSEILVARLLGGERTKRSNLGYDLTDGDGSPVEVKSRFIGRYGEATQYNFGRHSVDTVAAYCLAWTDDGKMIALEQVLRIPTPILLEHWSTNGNRYCARTTLGKLRALLPR